MAPTNKDPKAKGDFTKEELAELAANYGWSLAFLNTVPELRRLFNKAIDEGWEDAKFIAKLRDTRWFKKNSESAREYAVLLTTDPAEYKRRFNAKRAEVQDLSVELTGTYLTDKDARKIAEQSLMLGLNDAQLRNTLSNYMKQVGGSGGHYGGEAGAAENELREYAFNQGVTLSDPTLKKWLKAIIARRNTVQDYKGWIQGQAESSFTGLSKQIRSGMTVRQLANPYIEQMAETLELNPNTIDLKNGTIMNALQQQNKDGTMGMQSLGQFRLGLMQRPEYLNTKAARDSAADVGQAILKDFGLI